MLVLKSRENTIIFETAKKIGLLFFIFFIEIFAIES
ncbi:hypothetical protein J2W57_002250 [Chryseobacterium ginsenosidimutans]|uniref:Uncharacterized protein n=1 Tax=Chryseobacterium geocarposphaerae TaxID=1416776 RepID=A0ABU1LFZ5_9FLAO|nr:hypothetical protein [Chryseobacterium geocarposphaerae]MDR6698875.1 hypothetical protein [Chryseobacterium ginsenosidimutans]